MPENRNAIAGQAMAMAMAVPENFQIASNNSGYISDRASAQQVARHAALRFSWQGDLLASKNKLIAKIAGFALAAHVNDERGDFGAWPSQATLAAECGETARNVRRGLKGLLDTKYLEIVDGAGGGGRGRTTRYKLTFPADDKPGSIAPGINGDNPDRLGLNPAQLGSIPGSIGFNTRLNCADELTKELTKELNKELKEADTGKRLKPAESEFHLPGIDYGSLSGTEQLPEGLVRQARDDKTAWLYASRSATNFLGYERADKPDGVNADKFAMAFLPPAALAEMLARCRAGTLTNSTVAMAMLALRVPRGQHVPAPEPAPEPAAMHVASRATDENRLDHLNLKPQRK
jgi:hypothetical protein